MTVKFDNDDEPITLPIQTKKFIRSVKRLVKPVLNTLDAETHKIKKIFVKKQNKKKKPFVTEMTTQTDSQKEPIFIDGTDVNVMPDLEPVEAFEQIHVEPPKYQIQENLKVTVDGKFVQNPKNLNWIQNTRANFERLKRLI
jgi:hypothetical protein